jgi:glutamate racemase
VNSASAMAVEVAASLEKYGLRRENGSVGELQCFVTDLPQSFTDVAARFLGTPPGNVVRVDIS